MAQDRPEIQFSITGLSSTMSSPTFKAYKQLVHTVMYLRKRKTPVGLLAIQTPIAQDVK